VHVVAEEDVLDFLRPLPVRALWGVGPATFERLARLGVRTVGDLADLPLGSVTAALGPAAGAHLHRLANGIDPRRVEPDRPVKSISHEETFPRDLHEREPLERELVRLGDAVAARLRVHGLAGRTVAVKVRFHDFTTITRSTTLPEPTDSGHVVIREAKALLRGVDPAPGVRLLGVAVSQLGAGGVTQLRLELDRGAAPRTDRSAAPGDRSDAGAEAWAGAASAVDEIRDRFGAGLIGPAALLGPGGLRPKRRGDQQWGPDASVPAADAPMREGPVDGTRRGEE
jgi:DNA polymerase-4